MRYGCIGETLKHSFSAEIHGMLGEEGYELVEIPRGELAEWIAKRDFCGINVTIPYKQDVIPYLDEMDEQAKAIGAVNTVVNREGRLYGYNTDFYGMCALLQHLKADLKGKKVAILGTGGTSLTAEAVARHLGADLILKVSRGEKAGCVTYADLESTHADVAVLINTTPCGMFPKGSECPIDVSKFPRLECVADAVYNPLRTRLVLEARARGIAAEGGLYMLVAQGVRASEIFHDRVYPAGTVDRVWREIMRKKENFVLVGMPGSGKTTVGRILSEKTGRCFRDMDEEIASRIDRSPAEIIAEEGEGAFRDLESAVLRDVIAPLQGEVIATGGGAILRLENRMMLRQNGRVYFLDRPVDKLIPTADRPLSSTREALETRYRERYALYCASADAVIGDPETAEAAAEAIEKELQL